MSWTMLIIGAIASICTKPKPYTPSADYIRIKNELQKQWDDFYEPQRINLREVLPTDWSTEEERQECIKAWKDYYKRIRPNSILLIESLAIDGYNDVVNKLKINRITENWI